MKKCVNFLGQYRYAVLVLVIGLAFMLIPGQPKEQTPVQTQETVPIGITPEEKLAKILSSIRGAGRVEVLLSYAEGERTLYQTDNGVQSTDTVTVTDSERNQSGLVAQVIPPIYRGAVIVCQGGGNPAVRLAIVDAVSKFTGLGSNQIAVLEMK